MKTVDIKVGEAEYVIGRLNAQDSSFFCLNMFMPILAALPAAATNVGDVSAIGNILRGLKREDYNEVTHALFSLIKKRDRNVLCDVFKDGRFVYEDIQDDAEVYLTLLRESFKLSFLDFFVSAARVFPAVAVFLDAMKTMRA